MVGRYRTAPEHLDKIVRLFREGGMPLASRQPGFRGVYILTKADGEFTILNFWETEEQAYAYPKNPEQQRVVGSARDLIVGTPEIACYEVPAGAALFTV